MKVTLITPPSGFLLDERVFPTLGILRVGASLRAAGIDVDHLDLSGVSNYLDVVRDYKEQSIFAITATTPQMPAAVKIARQLKGRTILGGPHVTLDNAAAKRGNMRAELALFDLQTEFDCLVAGDGEQAIFAALVQGAGIIDADDPKSDLWQTSQKFTESPWPDRTLVDMDSYHYTIDGVRATSMISQLGCLAPDTPILLESGMSFPISDVQRLDRVVCVDHGGRKTTAEVVATWSRKANDLYEVEWDDGSVLMVTGEHPIMTPRGWATIEEARVGWLSACMQSMPQRVQGTSSESAGKVVQLQVQGEVAKDPCRLEMAE